jgi:transcriptional regulator with XRE-family HTH domain
MTLLNTKKMKNKIDDIEKPSYSASKTKSHEIEKHVGKKIKLFRQLKGLSQSEIAVHLGITFQQFQKYESGKNRIPVSRLIKLAEIFNVNMTVFFDNTVNVIFEDIMNKNTTQLNEEVVPVQVHTAKTNNENNLDDLSDELQTIIANFKSIQDPGVRKHIAMLVESLANK